MKATIFSKRIRTNDGKSFYINVTSLDKKDGTKQYMKVMYSGKDKNKNFDNEVYPVIIEFDRKNANVSTQTYTDHNGELRKSYTLWIKDYTVSDEVFVDHSLDDFI